MLTVVMLAAVMLGVVFRLAILSVVMQNNITLSVAMVSVVAHTDELMLKISKIENFGYLVKQFMVLVEILPYLASVVMESWTTRNHAGISSSDLAIGF
jgi:hypothetical protein